MDGTNVSLWVSGHVSEVTRRGELARCSFSNIGARTESTLDFPKRALTRGPVHVDRETCECVSKASGGV